jgi:hypothetical protein
MTIILVESPGQEDAMTFTDIAEAESIETLRELNAGYIRAFVESDTAWFAEHLSDDFVCTLGDGRRIDKPEFLELNAAGPGVTDVTYDVVGIRVLGEAALVHGLTHYTREGAPGSTSYTDVWHLRDGRWQAVAAQLTRVGGPAR